jgi:hypothetical protein
LDRGRSKTHPVSPGHSQPDRGERKPSGKSRTRNEEDEETEKECDNGREHHSTRDERDETWILIILVYDSI